MVRTILFCSYRNLHFHGIKMNLGRLALPHLGWLKRIEVCRGGEVVLLERILLRCGDKKLQKFTYAKRKSRLRIGVAIAAKGVERRRMCPMIGEKSHDSGREKGGFVAGRGHLCCGAGPRR